MSLCDDDWTYFLSQSSESVGGDEQVPVAAGNHIQKRPEQLQTAYQQAQLHQGIYTELLTYTSENIKR